MIKNLQPKLMIEGNIKIGMKGDSRQSSGGGTWRQPVKLPYFLLTGLERDSNENLIPNVELMKKVAKMEGSTVDKEGHLTSFPIRLLYDEIDANFQTRLASYNGSVCSCSGDGEKAVTKDKQVIKCPCDKLNYDYKGKDKCKYNGALRCIIEASDNFGSCFIFRTTSKNTVESIIGGLYLIKEAVGGLAFLPLHLCITPKTTTTPDGKPTKIYVVSIVHKGGIEKLQQAALTFKRNEVEYRNQMKQIGFEVETEMKLKPEEEKDFAEEFYPQEPDPEPGKPFEFKPEVQAEEIDAEKNKIRRINAEIKRIGLDKEGVKIAMRKVEVLQKGGKCKPFDVDSTKDIKLDDVPLFINWLNDLKPLHEIMIKLTEADLLNGVMGKYNLNHFYEAGEKILEECNQLIASDKS